MATRRITQRPALSCTECRRRKVRCDKKIPCQPCTKLGYANRCSLEAVTLSTRQTKSRDEIEFLQNLRLVLDSSGLLGKQEALGLIHRRLNRLETGQEDIPRSPRGADSTQSMASNQISNTEKSELNQRMEKDGSFDTAMVLLRLGRGYPDTENAPQPPESQHASKISWTEAIPDSEQAFFLVDYYFEHLSWHHSSIMRSEFVQQCVTFHQSDTFPNNLWLALYFSILSASAWNIPSSACLAGTNQTGVLFPEIITEDTLRSLSKDWYECMIKVLYDMGFMANYSAYSVQAILISSMVAHSLGKTSQHTILISAALRIAQCLGMGECQNLALPTIADEQVWVSLDRDRQQEIIQNESAKRTWWQLLIQDYFLVPMFGSYEVNPNHFTTALPSNCDDDNLIELPLDQPTISSYCIALAKVSLLMPELVDGLRSSGDTAIPIKDQYRHVQYIDAKMRQLVLDLPAFLRPETPEDASWPKWLPWARTCLTISAADKVIMIHRPFLVRSFQDPRSFEFTRRTCVSAALTILKEFHRVKDSEVVKIWIIPTFTVTAAIVLYLELVCQKTSNGESNVDGDYLDLLRRTIESLREMSYDHTAKRGVELLDDLVAQKFSYQSWDFPEVLAQVGQGSWYEGLDLDFAGPSAFGDSEF